MTKTAIPPISPEKCRHHARTLLAVCAVLVTMLLPGCLGVRDGSRDLPLPAVDGREIDYTPAATVTREEAVQIAESYRVHRWHPTQANVFHGDDVAGIRVDTPDAGFRPQGGEEVRPGWWVPGQINVGIPYQWGGFDTPRKFDQAVAAGKYAGDIYTHRKRALLDNAVSQQACGIDCSGFISRCWRLERSYSTRELAGLCVPLDRFSDLRTGDLVNKKNVHALLFVGFLDAEKTRFMAYETGSPPTWKVLRHPIRVDYVQGLGYRPYRYRGIRDAKVVPGQKS